MRGDWKDEAMQYRDVDLAAQRAAEKDHDDRATARLAAEQEALLEAAGKFYGVTDLAWNEAAVAMVRRLLALCLVEELRDSALHFQHGQGDADAPCTEGWRCSACGEAANIQDGRWRWNGTRWEHSHGQAGHIPAVPGYQRTDAAAEEQEERRP